MATVKEMNEILEECILTINPTTLANITTSKLNAYYQDVQLDMRRVVLVQNLFNDIYNNWTEYQIRYQHHQKQLKQKNKRLSQSRSSKRRSQAAAKAKRLSNAISNKENIKNNNNVPTNENDKNKKNDDKSEVSLGVLLKNKRSSENLNNNNNNNNNNNENNEDTKEIKNKAKESLSQNQTYLQQQPQQQPQQQIQQQIQQQPQQQIQQQIQQPQQAQSQLLPEQEILSQSQELPLQSSQPQSQLQSQSQQQFQSQSESQNQQNPQSSILPVQQESFSKSIQSQPFETETQNQSQMVYELQPQLQSQQNMFNQQQEPIQNGVYVSNEDIVYDSYVEEDINETSQSSDSESSSSEEEMVYKDNLNNAKFNYNNGYISSDYETEDSEDDYASNYESDYEKTSVNNLPYNSNDYNQQEPYTSNYLPQPELQIDDDTSSKGLRRQRSYSESQIDLSGLNNKDNKDSNEIINEVKYTRKTSVPDLTINTSINEQDSSNTIINDSKSEGNSSFIFRSFSIPPSSDNKSGNESTLLNTTNQSQNNSYNTNNNSQSNSLFIPPFELTESNTLISPIKFSWMTGDDSDEEENNNSKHTNEFTFPGSYELNNNNSTINDNNSNIPAPSRNISLNQSLPIVQNNNNDYSNNNNNSNNVNNNNGDYINNSQFSTLDNYVVRYPYYDDDEEDNFFNKNNYLYKPPQIHLEKQQIGQLEQLQSQIQPEYKEKIQQLQEQQEKLVIKTNTDYLAPPQNNDATSPKKSPKKSPKVPKIIIPKAQPETKLLNDYADVMDIVSLIPTILGENIDIPPEQSPIRQHFVSVSPTVKSVPITPLSEQINVTSKRHNEYIKKKEVTSLKRRSSLKYESYHGYDDSNSNEGSPAIVYSNPDTSCSFKRNSSGSSKLSINVEAQSNQDYPKAKSPLGTNAPMLPPMMMDSTTAAMLETHGNSLLLQNDPSMSNSNSSNNLMNMSFTEGVTNKINLAGSGSPELPNGKIANPLPRKAYRRRTLLNESLENGGDIRSRDDMEKVERRHRSRRHSHAHHRSMPPKDLDPEALEKWKEEERKRRERRHSRRPDEKDGERRERRHSRRPDETEEERRERRERRKSRRPVTIIDENGEEKVVHRHRRHHHRSSRYIEGENNEERPEKPKSSHRHSRHRQSVAVGEQQHSHSHSSKSYVKSRHQSLAPNKMDQNGIDYPSLGSTSFSLDNRSLSNIQEENNNMNNINLNNNLNTNNNSINSTINNNNNNNNNNTNNTSNTATTSSNLQTQEINAFFDNIFKLNWSL